MSRHDDLQKQIVELERRLHKHKDVIHDIVKQALIKDGWTITHDPLRLEFGDAEFFVDLGAEMVIGATKAEREIAVEVKSFIGASTIQEVIVRWIDRPNSMAASTRVGLALSVISITFIAQNQDTSHLPISPTSLKMESRRASARSHPKRGQYFKGE